MACTRTRNKGKRLLRVVRATLRCVYVKGDFAENFKKRDGTPVVDGILGSNSSTIDGGTPEEAETGDGATRQVSVESSDVAVGRDFRREQSRETPANEYAVNDASSSLSVHDRSFNAFLVAKHNSDCQAERMTTV